VPIEARQKNRILTNLSLINGTLYIKSCFCKVVLLPKTRYETRFPVKRHAAYSDNTHATRKVLFVLKLYPLSRVIITPAILTKRFTIMKRSNGLPIFLKVFCRTKMKKKNSRTVNKTEFHISNAMCVTSQTVI